MKKTKFFYARYDKNDNCLGVYDSMEEAIWKVYHVKKSNKIEYKRSYNSICRSYKKYKNNYGNVVSYKGFWYKFSLNKDEY